MSTRRPLGKLSGLTLSGVTVGHPLSGPRRVCEKYEVRMVAQGSVTRQSKQDYWFWVNCVIKQIHQSHNMRACVLGFFEDIAFGLLVKVFSDLYIG